MGKKLFRSPTKTNFRFELIETFFGEGEAAATQIQRWEAFRKRVGEVVKALT